MTLTELLVAISIMGVLIATIATTTTVAFRTAGGTEGRANVARAEQSLDLWLPADLRSVDGNDPLGFNVDPDASPCGDPVSCDGIDVSGANALQLTWTTSADLIDGVSINDTVSLSGTTVVQYQYIQIGTEWVIQRIECTAGSCRSSIVIQGVEAPPASPPAAPFDPALDSPIWAMSVTQPAPGDTPEVTVRINGGGESAGSGGGEKTITLGAGGLPTGTIVADAFEVEAFNRATSRCSGRITLLVDHSGSIGSTNFENVVKPGVQAFIDAFRGKPVQVQVILFGDVANALQPAAAGNQWHYYVDMRDDAAVNGLVSAVAATAFESNSTNWEEGFVHATKEANGDASWLPSRIILFTDGVPTSHRRGSGSWSNGTVIDYNDGKYTSPLWPDATGQAINFNQEAFDRTDVIVNQIRGSVDLIFVGVGDDLNDNATSKDPSGNAVEAGWIQNRDAFTNRDALPTTPAEIRTGSDVLERLLTGDDSISVIEATTDVAGDYDNVQTANYYRLQAFQASQFADAMRTTALKDCGGTVSIETVLASDGSRVGDEFIYENTNTFKPNGDSVNLPEPRQRTTTSADLPIGTLDWSIPASVNYYEVELTPQVNSTLDGYDFDHWECAFGSTPKTVTTVGAGEWLGVRVDLRANEALNCKMVVTPGPSS